MRGGRIPSAPLASEVPGETGVYDPGAYPSPGKPPGELGEPEALHPTKNSGCKICPKTLNKLKLRDRGFWK